MYPSLGGHTQKQRTYFLQQQQQKFLAAKLDKSSLYGRERMLGIPCAHADKRLCPRVRLTDAKSAGKPR